MNILAAVDIETDDPHLKIWGSGAVRKDGRILGVGVYCPELNIADYFDPGDASLLALLDREDVTKIFHNGVYDLDWLINGQGCSVRGRLEDTMTRDTLLDSYALSYSLDACCARRGVEGKNKGLTIDEWWKQNGGKGKAVENLKYIPKAIVGKYCIQDCKATYDLYQAQVPLLEAEDLGRANDIECRLYPFLISMRHNGFRLDWKGRASLAEKLNNEYDVLYNALKKEYNSGYVLFQKPDLNINSAKDLETIWKREGLPIEYTEGGRPSFTADILANCAHPVGVKIHRLRTIQKTLNTFIEGGFVDQSYEGKLWSTFYPAKRDDGGTVTGRWSSQNINLQQIPAREDKYGKEIRSLFIPEEGCLLGAFDYKQIEYRVFTHFASGPGAEEAKAMFNENPNTDYHQMTIDLMGWGDMGKEGRHLAKNFNFGSIYGLGPNSFAVRFKQNLLHAHPDADPDHLVPLAKSLMNMYYSKVAFAKPTCNKIQETATRRGYVKTLSGRRQRMTPDGKTYKLVNYLIQGSAADILKKGVVDAWEKGVFNILKAHAVVHDEVVFSIPKTKEGYEACVELYECMRNAYSLKIPVGVDTEIGPDWGHCTEDNWIEFKNSVKED